MYGSIATPAPTEEKTSFFAALFKGKKDKNTKKEKQVRISPCYQHSTVSSDELYSRDFLILRLLFCRLLFQLTHAKSTHSLFQGGAKLSASDRKAMCYAGGMVIAPHASSRPARERMYRAVSQTNISSASLKTYEVLHKVFVFLSYSLFLSPSLLLFLQISLDSGKSIDTKRNVATVSFSAGCYALLLLHSPFSLQKKGSTELENEDEYMIRTPSNRSINVEQGNRSTHGSAQDLVTVSSTIRFSIHECKTQISSFIVVLSYTFSDCFG